MSDSDLISLGFVIGLSALVIGGALWARRRSADPAALARRIGARRWPIALTASGAAIALTGVGMVLHATFVANEAVDLAEAERGAEIDAELATIEGHPRPEGVLCRTVRGAEECYTPVTSQPTSTVVAALVSGRITTRERGRFTGFLTRSNQLDVRRRIEEQGFVAADEPFRLLTESRADRSKAGSWVALAGAGLLVVGWWWLRRSR